MTDVEDIEEIKNAKYGIAAVSFIDEEHVNIEHLCLYWDKPTESSYRLLEEELNTDTAFSCVGRINKDIFLIEATDEMIEFYKSKFI